MEIKLPEKTLSFSLQGNPKNYRKMLVNRIKNIQIQNNSESILSD